MDNNTVFYEKYLKYKEKYLFLQQIAAGYRKQKDFTQRISRQETKIANITASLNSTKDQLKSAVAAEIASVESHNKDITDKNILKQLHRDKSVTRKLKRKLETIEKTLRLANQEYHRLVIQQRDTREKIAEYNVNYAKKTVLAKKKIVKKIQKKIEKLNNQLKKAEDNLVSAQTKEATAFTKLEEMKNSLVQVGNEELVRLGGVVNTPTQNQQVQVQVQEQEQEQKPQVEATAQ